MYREFHMKSFLVLVLGLLALIHNAANAQSDDSASSSVMTFKKNPIKLPKIGNLFSVDNSDDDMSTKTVQPLFKNYLNGLTVGGFYRGYFYSRNMTNNYAGVSPDQVLRVGEGQVDPLLMMYFSGTPTENTSFGADISLLNPFTAYRGPGYYTNGNALQYFTVVLRGSFKTNLGNFNMKAGGIEFLSITPFTFGANINFNRYSIFERRPWDPVDNIKNRYASYYYNSTLSQDQRFGTQAFKGFVMNGHINKINADVDFFYGKSAPNGGVNGQFITQPTQNIGLRFKKLLKNGNYVSLNTFNSYMHSDSVNINRPDIQWNIYTSEFNFKYKGITLSGEVGGGAYKSNTISQQWSGAVMADLVFPKHVLGIPLALRYYQIGQYFTSNVANFNNTTVNQVNNGYNGVNALSGSGSGATGNVLTPFGGALENVGDMSNNRRGVAINLTNIKVGKFSFTAGTQISAELVKLSQDTLLYYSHRVNNLVWQRLPNYFPVYGDIGPNQRIAVWYRGVSEKVRILDRNPDGTPVSKRYFNALDVQIKFKNKLFNRDFYMFYLGTFSSAQNSLSVAPKFNNSAYIRAQYHELETYYQITSELILSVYTGLELVKGNQYTDIDKVTGLPRNQICKAVGFGIDYSLSKSTTLFFRQRWFDFKDKSFSEEKFSGSEATVELKMFF